MNTFEENPFNHILYEFSMYINASTSFSDHQFFNNLLVDSKLIHLRNLAYFFKEEKGNNKNYMHYSMYINGTLSQMICKDFFDEIQKTVSNSTCHLLNGRLKKTFKYDTLQLEKKAFSILVSAIERFIIELNNSIKPEYSPFWMDKQIQRIVSEITDSIQSIEHQGGSDVARLLGSMYFFDLSQAQIKGIHIGE